MQQSWINKIIEHQTTPPQELWDSITSELDEKDEHLHTVKQKLLAYETAAPAIVFKNVFDELDKEDGKIYPITKNKQKLRAIIIRMAAAAAVITIAILLFFNNKKTVTTDTIEATIALSKPAINQPQPGMAAADSLPLPGTSKNADAQKIAAIPQQKISPLQAAVNYLQPRGGIIEQNLLQNANNAEEQTMQQLMPVSNTLLSALNRYITITGPGGESVKLSSKFGNIPGVFNSGNAGSEANIDAIIKQSSKWSNAFAGWRDKMAGSIISPSLINFLDIIELSDFLEDKKPTISQLDLRYLNLY
jgi:hypothetical protein